MLSEMASLHPLSWPWWPPSRLWRTTFSSPFDDLNEWPNWHVPPGTVHFPAHPDDRLQIEAVPGRGNTLRVEVRPGDVAHNSKGNGTPVNPGWRAEVVNANIADRDGQKVRYSWASQIPSEVAPSPEGPGVWQVLTQWHQGDNDGVVGPPQIECVVKGHAIHLHLNSPTAAVNPVADVRLVDDWRDGQWHAFTMTVLWSTIDGYIDISVDGSHKATLKHQPTLHYAASGQPGTVYPKMGIYRSATGADTKLAYHDYFLRQVPGGILQRPLEILRRALRSGGAAPRGPV